MFVCVCFPCVLSGIMCKICVVKMKFEYLKRNKIYFKQAKVSKYKSCLLSLEFLQARLIKKTKRKKKQTKLHLRNNYVNQFVIIIIISGCSLFLCVCVSIFACFNPPGCKCKLYLCLSVYLKDLSLRLYVAFNIISCCFFSQKYLKSEKKVSLTFK